MKHFCITLFLLFSVHLFAQQKTASISGKILDNATKQVVPYATIVIKSASGSSIITGGITNDNGLFKIEDVAVGDYQLEIQFIGYKTTTQSVSITGKNIDVGTIFLEESAESLSEVTVAAERSTITQKIDRKVINIGKDLTTAGASASDIMGNIPSVSVNQDGEISLRGNENVRILVDGKPTNISATDLLQQIPSTSIKTIELITNPSAKYNPEGMSGIINIILKKNSNLGFNGNVSSGVTFGKKTRFNGTLSMNYRAGKFNIYGSYGNRFGEQVTDGSVTRFIEGTNQLTENFNNRTSHLVKLGVDFFIDDRNTFSFYTNQNTFNFEGDGTKTLTFFNAPTSNFVQDDFIDRDNTNQTYNADFKHNFKESGHSLELEVDYNTADSDTKNTYDFTGNSPLPNYFETVDNKRANTTINLDYVNPVSENSTLEIGLETRLNRTDNVYKTIRTDLNNSDFSYDRDIYSFYTTFSQKLGKWQYNLGIRLEDYNVNSMFNELTKTNFKDKLFNVFPSGFLKYTPDEEQKNSYQLSVSRRIDRPSLNQINPIRSFSSPQIIAVGNQNLRPQFTNSVELNYTRKLNKGSISFGGFYRRINDEINRIGYFDTTDPNLFTLNYENFDSNDAYGFEFSSNYKPTKWWNFNASFDIYTRKQQGVIEGENVSVDNTLLNAKVNNSFKATKKLTFQLFTFYSGPQEVLQYELKSNFYMNVGARYNFAQGKGTLSVNFNDIFRTQRFAFETYRTIFQRGEFFRDTQTVYIGLSYRFGGGKNKALKRKKRDKNEKADRFL